MEGRKGRPHRRCLCRAPTPAVARWGGIAGAHRRSPGRAEGAERWVAFPPPDPTGGPGGEGSGAGPALSALPSLPSKQPPAGWRPSRGPTNVPDAWQAKDAPELGWLPYVFNKIRQIGPGDRDCSKPVIKQHKLGQCKRQKGPSWKDRWVPAPRRGGSARCEREPAAVPPEIFITFVVIWGLLC